MENKTGPELMVEIGKFPTLDELLNRNCHAKPYSRDELMAIVLNDRAVRAQFNIKTEKAAMKKAGIEDAVESVPDTDNQS